jgi:hypothetical protein
VAGLPNDRIPNDATLGGGPYPLTNSVTITATRHARDADRHGHGELQLATDFRRGPGHLTPARPPVPDSRTVTATDSDPVALQHFELVPSHALADVLGRESLEVWALRLSGGSVRDVATNDPAEVLMLEYVFAVPLDVMGNLARQLTEIYERESGTTL